MRNTDVPARSSVRDAIIAGIKADCSAPNGSVPVGTGEAFINTLIDGLIGNKGFFTPEAQLGAFNSTFSRSDGWVNIQVTNPISLNSFALHLTKPLGIQNPQQGPFSTINQTLQ